MKRIRKTCALFCAVALIFATFGTVPAKTVEGKEEEQTVASDCMDRIFENLTKEESRYTQSKNMYKDDETGEQFVKFTESCDDSKITISAELMIDESSDYYEWYKDVEGSWEFTLDGNYLTFTNSTQDYMGISLFYNILDAVCEYLGCDKDLVNGLLTATSVDKVTTKYYSIASDSLAQTDTMKLYVAGPWDSDEIMKALDGVFLDEALLKDLGGTALEDKDTNQSYSIGKMRAYIFGSKSSVEITVAEYGQQRGELSYKSIIDLVKVLKPNESDNFLENYKELQEVTAKGYSVEFPKDNTEVPDYYQDLIGKYQFTVIHFSDSITGEPSTPTSTPSATPTLTPSSTSTPSAMSTPTSTPSASAISDSESAADSEEKAEIIKPAKVKLTSVKSKKGKKVVVKWKKAANAKGYQIQYSTSKKFKKTTVRTTSTKKEKITLKLSQKTYYIRVRAYAGSPKKYGKWSDIRKVEVKK